MRSVNSKKHLVKFQSRKGCHGFNASSPVVWFLISFHGRLIICISGTHVTKLVRDKVPPAFDHCMQMFSKLTRAWRGGSLKILLRTFVSFWLV